ncbi:MAG TPA: asparaginase [Dongiaceae bacterium]|nr:asparaginase [Dongiaceae bacterium]
MANPLIIQVTRGELVESRHRIAAAICDGAGRLVLSHGDCERLIYGRSAIKPLLALPVIETGAVERLGLGDIEIALACASHNGEGEQVARVIAWLAAAGLSASDLECGVQWPSDKRAASDLIRAGRKAGPEHNNCSGKHAGFLSSAQALGYPTRDYIAFTHPLQQLLLGVLEDTTREDLRAAARGTDGCGIPTIAISIRSHAAAMARLASGQGLAPERAKAAQRICAAMMAEPYYVAGSRRYCTDFMKAFPGRAAIKVGAEGVYCAALPAAGVGLCLKAEDGAARAAEVALGHLLRELDIVDDEDMHRHPELFSPALHNWAGTYVGTIRPELA